MKKLIFVISLVVIIFSVTISEVYCQWIPQYTGTSAILRDIEFLNENTGWAVGDGGTCLKTTNGGTNWIQQNHPVGNKPLYGVHIVDSNVIYFVGYFQTIFKTMDGGISWRVIKNGPSGGGISYYSVFFINKDTGWIGEFGSYVLRTFDGGETFDSASTWGQNHDMIFLNRDTGFISSEGVVFRTTNAGTSWNPTLQLPHFYIFKKISFLKNGYGWVAAYNGHAVYRTTNFGDNWTLLCDSEYISGMFSCRFINNDTGFIGGLGNTLYKTTDGGFNWIRELTAIDPNAIESMTFINDTIGWASCTGGIILHTTTQGQIWTNISNNQAIIPENYVLLQNYPNPFNNQTKITFSILKRGYVNISVYDILSRKVDEITNKEFNNGVYEINYNTEKLSSGIYFYALNVNGITLKTNKFILIK